MHGGGLNRKHEPIPFFNLIKNCPKNVSQNKRANWGVSKTMVFKTSTYCFLIPNPNFGSGPNIGGWSSVNGIPSIYTR